MYEQYKMVMVVRADLKMGKGKVAAQVRSIHTYVCRFSNSNFQPHQHDLSFPITRPHALQYKFLMICIPPWFYPGVMGTIIGMTSL